jgi:hypothetical protein
MDCRKPLVLVLGLLIGAGGCASTLPGVRVLSGPPGKGEDGEMVHKAATYIAFGDFRATSAQAPENTPAQRQKLRDEARQAYLRAIEVDSGYLPAYVALARFSQNCEDYASAIGVYQKALKLKPREASLWFEMALCQCRTKDWSVALGNMRKALELEPGNRKYATLTGYTLARAGQWEEAYGVLARANGEARAHFDIARMLCHLKQFQEARGHLEAALAREPSFEAARTLLRDLANPQPAQPAPRIQTVSYTELRPGTAADQTPSDQSNKPVMPRIITPGSLGAPAPVSPPFAEKSAEPDEPTSRPIRVPPLPVVTSSPNE